VTKCVAA